MVVMVEVGCSWVSVWDIHLHLGGHRHLEGRHLEGRHLVDRHLVGRHLVDRHLVDQV